MLLAALLILATISAGTLATYLYDDEAPPVARIGFGTVTGLAVVALVGFLIALAVGISLAAQILVLLTVVASSLLVWTPIRAKAVTDLMVLREQLRAAVFHPTLGTTAILAYIAAMGLFLWLVFDRILIVEPTGVYTGYVNNLGDLPFHTQVTASFAFAGNFPPEDPTFAGTSFSYPYMADFLTAILVTLGSPLDGAFLLQNLALAAALVIVLHRFARVLTGDGLAALIAPLLVLLSGGLGWIMLVDEVRASELGLLAYLSELPHDYTIGVPPYRWGNAITTLLVTQRSLAFGLPLTLVVFTQLWRLIHSPAIHLRATDEHGVESVRSVTLRGLRPAVVKQVILERPEALAAGAFTGLLPLVHAHSFIVVMGTAFLLGVLFRQWRDGRWLAWSIYVVAALAIALPEIWWSTHGSQASAQTFFGIELGWDHGTEDIAWFWFLNTGVFIPLLLYGLVAPVARARAPRALLLFSLPFLVWFIVPNVARLAPWVWDNIKVLFYWYVGFVPLVSLLIARHLRKRWLPRALGAALLMSLVLAGSVDIWRVVSGQTVFQEFDADGVAIAEHIRLDTPQRALILHAPTWNPPVFLTGRRSLLGYTGYIWAHGLDYAPREADIKRIYAGESDAVTLLAQYGVDYVLVSPLERSYMTVNDQFFSRFKEVATAGEYRLYQIDAPTS